jgi:hypothetical protein
LLLLSVNDIHLKHHLFRISWLFWVRDRVEDEVVFSFRVMVEPKYKEMVKTNLSCKLGALLSVDKFAVDPAVGNSLEKYVAWLPNKRIADFGESKFNLFIDLLKNLSVTVVQMIENTTLL